MNKFPIDTAPKDGRAILLHYDEGWIQGRWGEFHRDFPRKEWVTIVLDSHGCGCCGTRDDDPT